MARQDDAFSFFLRGSPLSEAIALEQAKACLRRVLGAPAPVPDEVEACYRLALEHDPGCLEACLKLGERLLDRGDYEPAGSLLHRALERDPQCASAWQKLAALCLWTGCETEAEDHLRRALQIDGNDLRARFHLSHLLLGQGRFEEGWRAREARPARAIYARRVEAPEWQGGSPAGKALLIGPEAGFGDMIQFSRYVPVLKAQGAARVGIVCQPPLKRLFATLPGVDQVTAVGEPLPDEAWDAWVLAMSLPCRCGTTLATVPAPVPYLRPDPALVEAWAARLPEAGLRVGLAWQGNPHHENDGRRSLPGLSAFRGLADLPGAQFISLQAGLRVDPPPGLRCFDPQEWLGDFADTAAIIAQLDRVITVDTAVAHLAGALGRPCWVLLPASRTDWRWLKDREDSPWYPGTMRLFRQGPGEGWDPVLDRVAQAARRLPLVARR